MGDACLVTGGAGFIGSNLVRGLLKEKKNVRVIDNLSTGDISNLKDVLEDIEFIEGDIRYLNTIQEACKGVKYVFHQAAVPSVPRSIENPVESNQSNVDGTLNVLVAARDKGVKRVIFAGSSSVYGDTPQLPKTEDMKPNPLSPYAITKLTGEYYCKIFSEVFGLQTVTTRYFNVFGPRQDPESQYAAVIPKFIEAFLRETSPTVYGDGEQTRDFTYVENVVHANILCSRAKKTNGDIINIATSFRISLNELIKLLKDITGKEIKPIHTEPRKGDIKHSLADISRAKKLIGYRPLLDLKQGLVKTLQWMKQDLDIT
ncbi:MAG: NAD-dependent epimerase/dehydratase family protein [Candidatus Aminicenantes bacterium]|nr:NAD-dependent epimerase/dehydratase family protein [Candidatus Aminicenantes bacterium]